MEHLETEILPLRSGQRVGSGLVCSAKFPSVGSSTVRRKAEGMLPKIG